jgi:hypothetical protein
MVSNEDRVDTGGGEGRRGGKIKEVGEENGGEI